MYVAELPLALEFPVVFEALEVLGDPEDPEDPEDLEDLEDLEILEVDLL